MYLKPDMLYSVIFIDVINPKRKLQPGYRKKQTNEVSNIVNTIDKNKKKSLYCNSNIAWLLHKVENCHCKLELTKQLKECGQKYN